jgi:DNA-binding NtrC family response regulator
VLLSQGDVIGSDAIVMPDGAGLSEIVATASLATQAAQVAESISRSLVGRTVAEVEREMILDTLDHVLGNRTHAANILGISIRTLRNKLNQYADEGTPIPAPGEARKSA